MEEPVETLLEQFAEPLENEDALYQDYVQAHRSAYVKLRQRPEEVLPLILPELLSDREALECYSDDTSRTTLLYCLFKDILQGEPFSWDAERLPLFIGHAGRIHPVCKRARIGRQRHGLKKTRR